MYNTLEENTISKLDLQANLLEIYISFFWNIYVVFGNEVRLNPFWDNTIPILIEYVPNLRKQKSANIIHI